MERGVLLCGKFAGTGGASQGLVAGCLLPQQALFTGAVGHHLFGKHIHLQHHIRSISLLYQVQMNYASNRHIYEAKSTGERT
jgi:hypothetical protein